MLRKKIIKIFSSRIVRKYLTRFVVLPLFKMILRYYYQAGKKDLKKKNYPYLDKKDKDTSIKFKGYL